MTTDDDLARKLRALPERAPPSEVDDRIRSRARQVFERCAASRPDRVVALLGQAYTQVETAMAVGITVVYLGWAVQTVLSLHP